MGDTRVAHEWRYRYNSLIFSILNSISQEDQTLQLFFFLTWALACWWAAERLSSLFAFMVWLDNDTADPLLLCARLCWGNQSGITGMLSWELFESSSYIKTSEWHRVLMDRHVHGTTHTPISCTWRWTKHHSKISRWFGDAVVFDVLFDVCRLWPLLLRRCIFSVLLKSGGWSSNDLSAFKCFVCDENSMTKCDFTQGILMHF